MTKVPTAAHIGASLLGLPIVSGVVALRWGTCVKLPTGSRQAPTTLGPSDGPAAGSSDLACARIVKPAHIPMDR